MFVDFLEDASRSPTLSANISANPAEFLRNLNVFAAEKMAEKT